jgi:ABC-type glycerol-3-phosphate transport system substrate-binding protein
MRKMLGVAAAAALAFSVSAASAEEITGTVSNIDLTRATFMVDGKTYTASPTNTVGVTIDELKEGDTVKLDVATADAESGTQPINVMALEKVE